MRVPELIHEFAKRQIPVCFVGTNKTNGMIIQVPYGDAESLIRSLSAIFLIVPLIPATGLYFACYISPMDGCNMNMFKGTLDELISVVEEHYDKKTNRIEWPV